MPVMPLMMAECERPKSNGKPCRIRSSFVGTPDELPEGWARLDGVITCSMCLRSIDHSEETTRETRRP